MYHVTCNTDDKYAQHCIAMLCSLFENNSSEQIKAHILCNNLSEQHKIFINHLAQHYNQEVAFYTVNETPLEGVQFRSKRPLSKAAYYRLLLSSILKEVDKVLYLDCDIIVLGKIKELFDIELDNYALAATVDGMPYNNQHQMQLHLPVNNFCFCSGIMLINLNYWRKYNIEEKLISFAKRKREPVFLHDQDVLNYVLRNQWFMLPPKWNYNPANIKKSFIFKPYHYADMIHNPCVIHYYSEIFKPWYKAPCPAGNYYRHYLKLSHYENPHFQTLPIKKYIYSCYYYLRVSLIRLKPLMPQLLIIIFTDIFNILRLILYILSLLISPKSFHKKISKFYEHNRI